MDTQNHFELRKTLGIDIHNYRKRIQYQFTSETNWSNIEIDHVEPFFLFDISNNNDIEETFCWKNTQPLLKDVHQHKVTKFNFLDYQLLSIPKIK